MISASTSRAENCFKHPPIVVRVHRSSNSKLLNYDLIHEKYIQFPFLHAVLWSDLSMI